LDHAGPEARLVVQNVVGNAEPVGHPAGVVDVLAGAAGPAPSGRRAVVVELQRDADDIVALALEEHGHDHARACGWRKVAGWVPWGPGGRGGGHRRRSSRLAAARHEPFRWPCE